MLEQGQRDVTLLGEASELELSLQTVRRRESTQHGRRQLYLALCARVASQTVSQQTVFFHRARFLTCARAQYKARGSGTRDGREIEIESHRRIPARCRVRISQARLRASDNCFERYYPNVPQRWLGAAANLPGASSRRLTTRSRVGLAMEGTGNGDRRRNQAGIQEGGDVCHRGPRDPRVRNQPLVRL